jgi:hypothetical protein
MKRAAIVGALVALGVLAVRYVSKWRVSCCDYTIFQQ